MQQKVLITGYAGQLGTYLSRIALGAQYIVHGVGSDGKVKDLLTHQVLTSCDLLCSEDVRQLLSRESYTVIYNLAALSSVGQSWLDPHSTFHVNTKVVINILDAAKEYGGGIRVFQASSADVYACATDDFVSEKTSMKPGSPYGVSKAAAGMLVDLYREKFGVEVINGILFASESPLRNQNFVSMKIIRFLTNYSVQRSECLELGNIDIPRDFGFAGEYAEIIANIMTAPKLKNVVIATGRQITLREFIDLACAELNIYVTWQGEGLGLTALDRSTGIPFIRISEKYFRPNETVCPQADISVLRDFYQMEPKVFPHELVKILINEGKLNNV